MTANDDARRPGGRAMQNSRPSLLAVVLRALADWASGGPKRTARTERRRRVRQRLRDRATLADFFQEDAAASHQRIGQLEAERLHQQREAELFEMRIQGLVEINQALSDACHRFQRESDHWRRIAEHSCNRTREDDGKIILQ